MLSLYYLPLWKYLLNPKILTVGLGIRDFALTRNFVASNAKRNRLEKHFRDGLKYCSVV